MIIQELINQLQKSGLYAECPCGEEFKLSDAILFDGTKPFPKNALDAQKRLKELLEEREEDLKKRKKLATDAAQNTTKSVNLGKRLETVLPTLKDYKWELPDSRFLNDPIDLITFNGLAIGKVSSISFVEIKSGQAKLNNHQKSVRDAIADKKVSYKEYK
jgi:predicted Holliday junction resolvase-like endonuclease